MPPQPRRRLLQGFQQIRREPQQLRRQQTSRLGRQGAIQSSRRHHQHRRPGHRVPQSAAGIQQRCQGRDPAVYAHPDIHQLSAQAVAGRRPKHHRQYQVGRRRGDQQYLGGDIGIENAPDHRDTASRQKAQPQHAPSHGAGHSKEQQRQPQQTRFGAEGDQGKNHTHRDLYRQEAQKAAPRQKHRHGVGSAQHCRQRIAPAAQPDARQPPGAKHQQIVHQGVQHKDAVHINGRHGPAPLRHGSHYRTAPPGKPVAKRRRTPRKSGPPLLTISIFVSVCQKKRSSRKGPPRTSTV